MRPNIYVCASNLAFFKKTCAFFIKSKFHYLCLTPVAAAERSEVQPQRVFAGARQATLVKHFYTPELSEKTLPKIAYVEPQ